MNAWRGEGSRPGLARMQSRYDSYQAGHVPYIHHRTLCKLVLFQT